MALVGWVSTRLWGRPSSQPVPTPPSPPRPERRPTATPEPSTEPAEPRPRVFISYAHEPNAADHPAHVLDLAQRLRADGVDAWIDRFEQPDVEWAQWMARQVERANRILCVCTETYKHRFDGEPDKGHDTGVRFEGPLIRERLKRARGTEPHGVGVVAFDPHDLHAHVPYVLRPTARNRGSSGRGPRLPPWRP
ncbi:MAG: toll/interleukin-1 receptor domain-containing protein [Myxococcota bacterium]